MTAPDSEGSSVTFDPRRVNAILSPVAIAAAAESLANNAAYLAAFAAKVWDRATADLDTADSVGEHVAGLTSGGGGGGGGPSLAQIRADIERSGGLLDETKDAVDGISAGDAPTVAEIRTEMESSGSKLKSIEDTVEALPSASDIAAEMEGSGSTLQSIEDKVDDVQDGVDDNPTAVEVRQEMESTGHDLAVIKDKVTASGRHRRQRACRAQHRQQEPHSGGRVGQG